MADDFRFAWRRLAKRPAATIASIATLGAAIGAAVAAWSLISAVLLHPLPIAHPDRLVVVGIQGASRSASVTVPLQNGHIYTEYSTIRASGIFQSLAAGGGRTSLVTVNGETSPRPVFFASHDYFDTIGVRLQAGRGFTVEDDRPGAAPVAILADRFWRRAFDGRANVLGQSVLVAGKTVVVVGIAPAGFRGLELASAPDLYLPMNVIADVMGPPTNWFADPAIVHYSPTAWVRMVGLLAPATSVSNATAQLNALPHDAKRPGPAFGLTDVNTAALSEGARPAMAQFARLLAVTVGFLLVIGCLSVGMLVLLRTEARREELAMCLALGATPRRLALGIIVEGALLAVGGAALGLPLSRGLLDGLRTFQLPGGVDIDLLAIPIDERMFAACVGAAIASTLLVSLVAGVFGFSGNIATLLRAHGGATPRLGRRRTRSVLIVAQVAVAIVLLAGAGLFIRSIVAALELNAGYETGHVATGSLSLAEQGYSPIRALGFFDELRERLMTIPEIRSVAVMHLEGGMGGGGNLVIDDETRAMTSFVAFNAVDSRYFRTMGLSIERGRDFTPLDARGAPRVAIVSESFGRLLARGGNPLGHHITDYKSLIGHPPDVIEVVGVVPDIVTNVAVLQPLALYFPLAQGADSTSGTILIRGNGDMSSVERQAVATIRSMEPALPMPQFVTLEERISKQMGPQKLGATVLGALGTIAALLTLFGIYVLAESMASLRRREMGVRAALGATRGQLSALVLIETTRLIGLGIVSGLVLVWLGASLIGTFLFGVQPLDPTTLVTVALTMLTLALLVSLGPALGAARVDLAHALREE